MIEILVILLIVIIIGCFGVQLFLSQPQIEPLLQGMFVPKVISSASQLVAVTMLLTMLTL